MSFSEQPKIDINQIRQFSELGFNENLNQDDQTQLSFYRSGSFPTLVVDFFIGVVA
ncbi:MAG TPA: hypothetical protein VFR02_00750 [bacterium]|nr:hypothetical protein [bacterium]